MSELGDAVSFHGHLCPMFYLGFRMGRHALRKLDREREKGIKLHCVVEFQNCFGDGIQYVTGATFGKNNLHLDDMGKFAASFYDLAADSSLRLKMNDEVVKRILVYGEAGKNVKSLAPERRAAETSRLMAMGKEMVEDLKGIADEELFVETPAQGLKASEGARLEYVVCESCGELTLVEYTSENNGLTVCKKCC